jgi:integrase
MHRRAPVVRRPRRLREPERYAACGHTALEGLGSLDSRSPRRTLCPAPLSSNLPSGLRSSWPRSRSVPTTRRPPRRAVLTADQYEALRGAAGRSDPVLELFVVLVHETGHRAGSIRRLRWSDVDLERRTVRWRGEFDKMRSEHVTPLSDAAVAVLSAIQRRQGAIGDVWIFPRPEDSAQPWSAHQASKRFRTIADAVGLPVADRYGWHAFRRQFASELKAAPLKDLCHLGGWKNEQTVLRCYQVADEATQRAALAQRKSLRVSGLS